MGRRRTRELGAALRRVLAYFDGNKAEMARRIGVESREVIHYWVNIGYIPGKHALKVSLATGNEVSALELLHEAEKFEVRKKLRKEALGQVAPVGPAGDVTGGA